MGNWIHRDVYFTANPFPPWTCFVCHGEIWSRSDCDVHHEDMEKRNNHLNNLLPAHPDCHRGFHRLLGALAKEAVKRNLSTAL